jgi:predicted alpha-1,2-mannosidase
LIGTGGHGHTFPGATVPFGMVQLSPDTRLEGWDGCSGYHDSDRVVYGFSHTHLSGTGVSDYGDVLFMATTGPLLLDNGYKKSPDQGYASRFDKRTERASPGYYSVVLDDYKVKVELTATERAGFHKYTFPASQESHIIIDLAHRDPLRSSTLQFIDNKTLVGMRRSKAWAQDQIVFFAAQFSKPFASYGFDTGKNARSGALRDDTAKKAYVNFATRAAEVILVKVGISAVSVEGAQKNLKSEIPHWDFHKTRVAADLNWNQALSKMTVDGDSDRRKRIFYSALYHSMIAPNLFSDVDGRYRGMDRNVHKLASGRQYTVFSLWDTFRAAHPLLTLIEQQRSNEFIQTFLRQYKQGGRLPVWELSGNETDCMIGYHAAPVIVDAYVKGLRDYDPALALEAMTHSAQLNERGLKDYRRRGYIDSADEAESVSKTLEYAYDDWCIAQLGRALGKKDIAARYLKRAQSYKNLFDPNTGFFRAKVNGRWQSPFDAREVNFNFTEANAWQYSLFVPQDITGLIKLMGGEQRFSAHLDRLFQARAKTTGRNQADITGLIGQYAHGNEPSHHMAYLYNFVGEAAKTQARVHEIMTNLYTDKPSGYSGNEDCGQMSSWYVLSALGIYPVTPGAGRYVFGSPLFKKATLSLENGRQFTFKAKNQSADNIYIQSVTLNGDPYHKLFINHSTIMAGGELIFEMGPKANNSWIKERPSAVIKEHLITAVPYFQSSSQTFHKALVVAVKSPQPGCVIYYTLDNSIPTIQSARYNKPIKLTETAVIRAISVSPAGDLSLTVDGRFYKVRADRSIKIQSKYASQYAAGGDRALIDSLRGGKNFRTGRWQGYQQDLKATVDLGEIQHVEKISMGFLQDIQSWIWMPKTVTLFGSSDGRAFQKLATLDLGVPDNQYGALTRELSQLVHRKLRYIRIEAQNYGRCPDWHLGAGGAAWIFIDEVTID